jgi:hypothetical protein
MPWRMPDDLQSMGVWRAEENASIARSSSEQGSQLLSGRAAVLELCCIHRTPAFPPRGTDITTTTLTEEMPVAVGGRFNPIPNGQSLDVVLNVEWADANYQLDELVH